MTLVAIDAVGVAVGAVALGISDEALTDDERSRRSPWLLGLIVDPNHRQQGIGRRLVDALEDLARKSGHSCVWVATGPLAVGFYVRCGWDIQDELTLSKGGWHTFILKRSL